MRSELVKKLGITKRNPKNRNKLRKLYPISATKPKSMEKIDHHETSSVNNAVTIVTIVNMSYST